MITDTMLARWARLKRYKKRDIDELHRIEREAEAGVFKSLRGGFSPEHTAIGRGLKFMAQVDANLPPFWPSRTPVDHRKQETDRFNQRAYAKTVDLIDDKNKYELESLHEADWIIFNSDLSIDREWKKKTSNPELDRLKKRNDHVDFG